MYRTDFFVVNIRNEFKEVHSLNININAPNFPETVLKELSEFVKKKEIWAAGVVSPGLINNETGINHTYPYHNAGEKSLKDVISEAMGLPTFICHDTQAALIGEHYYGLAKGRDNVLLINLDWGIGLGVLCNGVIIKGSKGFAGELGHIQVKPDGALCKCGKIGCLETVASASVLLNNAKTGLEEGGYSILMHKKDNLKIEDIIEACHEKDEFSINLVNDIGNELGKGLAIAVHLFNPEKIVIEGILSQTSDIIIDAMQKSIRNYCLFDFRKDLKIEVSPLGKNAKILGMKSLVFNEMLAMKNL